MGALKAHWLPRTSGTDFEFNTILKPLEPLREWVTVVSNLDRPLQGTHAVSSGTWLTGSVPKRTEAEDFQAGISLDQIIADQIGRTRCGRPSKSAPRTSSATSAPATPATAAPT